MVTLDDRSRRQPTVDLASSHPPNIVETGHSALCTPKLESNALSHWQPMKLPQDGRDVLTTSGTSSKTCCSILYGLKTPEKIVRDAEQQRVTVVKTQRDECVNSRLRPIHGPLY